MAIKHQFRVLEFSRPQTIEGEPVAIYRYIERSESNRLIELDAIITVDDYIEDPEVSDFFVVLKCLDDYNRWLCYYHARYAICAWLTKPAGYKGSTFLDAGYFYCPYVPISKAPVILDPTTFSKSKGILTRYGKKLLASGKQKMNGLIYYLRLRGDTVYIESDTVEAKIQELTGFIRLTPEIKFAGENGDVTVEYIAGLKDECDSWPISEEQKVKFKEDADKWIVKRKK